MNRCRKESFGQSSSGNVTLRCALVLAFGAPLLGGCAASHVGSAWQCPMLEGQPCVSVAEVDPAGAGARRTGAREGNTGAGPNRADGNAPVWATPLYRTPSATDGETDDTAVLPPRRGCRGGCRPFAWLRRLGRHGTEASPEESVANADTDTGVDDEPLELARTDTSTLDDLRTPEVIGRIWIAPYVDSLGVYREASWVRVVFEPAGWKHP